LISNLTPPERLDQDKAAYEKALEEQLQKQSEAVMKESEIKQEMLKVATQTRIEKYKLQQEEAYKIACTNVQREAQNTCSGLREAAILEKTKLDERHAMMVFDFQKKKAQEELNARSYQLKKEWFDGEARLMHEYKKVMGKNAPTAAPITRPAASGVTTTVLPPTYVAAGRSV